MTKFDIAVLWATSYFAALVGLAARIAYLLYGIGECPPEDPAQLAAWERRRRWLSISEFSALPAMATGWTAGALWWPLPVPMMVLGCMASGALGFGFLLHALQGVITRRVERA